MPGNTANKRRSIKKLLREAVLGMFGEDTFHMDDLLEGLKIIRIPKCNSSHISRYFKLMCEEGLLTKVGVKKYRRNPQVTIAPNDMPLAEVHTMRMERTFVNDSGTGMALDKALKEFMLKNTPSLYAFLISVIQGESYQQSHVLPNGDTRIVKASATLQQRVKVAQYLINKTIPDIKNIEFSGNKDSPPVIEFMVAREVPQIKPQKEDIDVGVESPNPTQSNPA